MFRRIDRSYSLTPEEVQNAMWRYLKESRDVPVPDAFTDLRIVPIEGGEGAIDVRYVEFIRE